MKRCHLLSTCCLLCILFFFCVPVSHAHRVVVFAWIEGKTVHTVSKFPGGNRAVDSTVVVYDDLGDRLLEGKTDDQGNFSFPIPKRSALKIVLEAGAGHQGEWLLSEAEIAAALDGSKPAPVDQPEPERRPKPAQGPEESAPSVHAAPVQDCNEKQIAAIVDRTLDRKLQPMMKMLADLHDPGPSLSDIFGGIGYILGLFGVAALIAARKKQ